MAKKTAKYLAALRAATELGFPGMEALNDAPAVYSFLAEKDWFWNAGRAKWSAAGKADPPSKVVRIRVVTDKRKVEKMGSAIAAFLSNNGFRIARHSEPIKRRPPQHKDAAVYLEFETE